MKKLLILSLLMAAFVVAYGQPAKPGIRVSVKIIEKDFDDIFHSSQQRIEKRIADSVASFLSLSYPIFSFSSTNQKPDMISIELRRPMAYRNAPLSYSVDMVLKLAGPNVQIQKSDTIKWTFAKLNRWPEWITTEQEFVSNVMLRFKECIGEKEDAFFRLLRCRWFVEGVAEVKVDKQNRVWTINLTYGDLGTGLGTQFKVLQNHSQNRVLRYYIEAKSAITATTIMAKWVDLRTDDTASEPGDDLNELPSFQSVDNIQILKITPFKSRTTPVSPTEVNDGNHH